jgi:hypothetical protein
VSPVRTVSVPAVVAARGKYKWNTSTVCGMPGVTACKNPSAFVNWDGVHFTEATSPKSSKLPGLGELVVAQHVTFVGPTRWEN